jgi:hypothetical protein
MTGNGESGDGVKETWRTDVVLIIVWMVVREYTANSRISREASQVVELGRYLDVYIGLPCCGCLLGIQSYDEPWLGVASAL